MKFIHWGFQQINLFIRKYFITIFYNLHLTFISIDKSIINYGINGIKKISVKCINIAILQTESDI